MKTYTELQMKSMFVSGCEHYADCLKTAEKLNLDVANKLISQIEFSAEKTKKEDLNDYLEAYFDTVQFITDCLDRQCGDDRLANVVSKRQYEQGSGGTYELAKEWTDEFTEKYKDVAWGEEIEYYDTIEEFLTNKNKL